MAKTKIRGITIELGADFTEVTDAFKEVTKQASGVDKSLKDVNKLLKLDPTNVELLTQKQGYLEQAIDLTAKRLEEEQKMLEALPTNPNGEMTEQQKALAREIEATKQKLDGYQSELGQTDDALKEAGKQTSTFGDVLKANLSADAIKAFGKALLDLGKQIWQLGVDTASYADNVLTLSTQYNLSTEAIQEYQYMSELTDTSLETITGSLSKLTKSMQASTKGTGDAYNAFQQLGIDIYNADGTMRNANDVFTEAIGKLGTVENATERDSLAMNIFGRSAMDLNPLIAVGADELRSYADEAHEMGYVLDNDTLTALGGVDDAMQRANKAMDAVKMQIGSYLAPVVAQITEAFAKWAMSVDWQKVGAIISSAVDKIGKAINWLINVFKTVIDVGATVGRTLRDIFTGNFKFPHIPLPHFGISPSGWKIGDLLKGSIPRLNIQWYAKAMDNGMVLDQPTIFGMDRQGNLLGGGEAGKEVVIGYNRLMDAFNANKGNTVINVTVNEATNARETADAVLNLLQRNVSTLERSWR